MDDISAAAALSLCALAFYNYVHVKNTIQTKKRLRKRKWWLTSIHKDRLRLTRKKRRTQLGRGGGGNESRGRDIKCTRMSTADFEYLLNKISPVISKPHAKKREVVSPRTRLDITLRYLTSGDSLERLNFIFKVSPRLITKIIPQVCEALNLVLKDEIKVPSSTEEWLQVERGFNKKFPHAIGSIDGKYIVTRPSDSESDNFDDNENNIVILSVIDSNYNFIAAEISSTGRINDGKPFRNCLLWQRITSNDLNFPTPQPLRGSVEVPYILLGDDVFALSTHIMKPYVRKQEIESKGIFNQKLFKARVVVENTFGILASKFKIFRRPISLCSDKVSVISMSCLLLHNFLRKSKNSSQIYTPPGTFDVYDENGELLEVGSWRTRIESTCAIRNLPTMPRNQPSELNAIQIREEFTNYFINKT